MFKLYKTDMAKDAEDVLEFMKTKTTEEILKNTSYWGMDLSFLKEEIEG